MNSSIEILNEKNLHLEKFYRLNEAALEKFNANDFDGLDEFYKTREGILDIIRKLDEMLSRMNDSEIGEPTEEMAAKNSIVAALDLKNKLVTHILEQDLRILSILETTKSSIIKELAQVRGAKKAVGAYHTNENKTRLNEKA